MKPDRRRESTAYPDRRAIIAADASGRVRYSSLRGEQFLERYFGVVAGDRLPASLKHWLQSAVLGLSLILDGDTGQLTIRLLEAKSKTGWCLLLSERAVPFHSMKQSLTAREREVLDWVAVGKSNCQIGQILNLTTATVRKHLQNIFLKLGVENRTAAAGSLMEMRRP